MDLYSILGIDKMATEAEIKKSYYKAAKKVHPDTGGSKEKMQEINQAYEILSNPESRKKYDETGVIGGENRSIYDLAKAKLMEMFALLISQGDITQHQDLNEADIKKLIVDAIEISKKDINLTITSQKKAKTILEKMPGRMTGKFAENFKEIIEARIHQIDIWIDSNETQNKINDMMLEFLEDFEYKFDEKVNLIDQFIRTGMGGQTFINTFTGTGV